MKRLVVVLGGLLALPAFAEVAPFFYDEVAEYADTEMMNDGAVVGDEIVAEEGTASAPVIQSKPMARPNALTRNASRALPTDVTSERAAGSRSVASRGALSARTTTTGGVARSNTSRAVASRSGTQSTGTVSARNVANSGSTVARVGVSGGSTATMTTSQGQTVAVAETGTTGRVGVRAASSTARAPSIAAVSVSNNSTVTNADSIKELTTTMDALTELSDYCKAQYTACMDNFCNVLDDNQGRCSCSKNVKNYEKTETALKAATEELQEVAQKIQYIGLSKDEINTLFSQTEAEAAMQGASDSSQLKSSLDKVKNMIVDVKGGTASAYTDGTDISLDLSNLLSFSIDSTGFDLSALFGTKSTNTSSVSNQRGETLYKTAASRCKAAVLNTCANQGVDISVVSNSYDLEIDKQCVAYERALSDSNTQMSATVRNAKTVLQKARLMVAQQKNQYDLRGCISALDSCMQDDYVCGADYEYCLDPSGKYVVDGAIVVGSLPGKTISGSMGAGMFGDGLYATWGSSSPWDGSNDQNGALATYINSTVSGAVEQVDSGISKYLQYKIGYNANGKNYGMCMSVLNKCQDYTYNNGTYNASNRVIKEYLYRALPKIKAAQDELLSSYAESCIGDVTSCLSANNYISDAALASLTGANATAANTARTIAVNACKSVIRTCMSVNGAVTGTADSNLSDWANGVFNGVITSTANN